MRTITIITAVVALALSGAAHSQNQSRPQPSQRAQPSQQGQPTAKPSPKPAAAAPAAQGGGQKSRYGIWQGSWGKAPPAPPAHFAKTGDWYRHVRACRQKFRSYSAKTDTYRTYSGKTVRCRL